MSALYDQIGTTYARYRRPDARIAAAIDAALEGCVRVVSIGSGTGAYEPRTRGPVAVEPSRTMIGQGSEDAAPVVQGVAERLPFGGDSFDAALAVLAVHHWPDTQRGLAEMRRVASKQVVLTWDPAIFGRYWFVPDYLPEIAAHEAPLATLDAVCAGLNVIIVQTVPVPWDCTDGFMGAYWRRPERYLDSDARAAISSLSLFDQNIVISAMQRLEADLADGTWKARNADLADRMELDLGYRLVVAQR
jgi:SAM-dependent methyltransferase